MTLYPYQLEGADICRRALATSGGFILADEMGLGKTAQALRAVAGLPPGPITVVCPASVQAVWRSEAERWAPGLLPRLEVVSWDRWKTRRGAAGHVLIADEAHYARTPSSARAKALVSCPPRYRYRLLLTGTPVCSCVHNLWPLLACVAPESTPPLREYEERYCDPTMREVFVGPGKCRIIRDVSGLANAAELRARLDRVLLRRRKKDVLPQLPPFRRARVPLPHAGRPWYETMAVVKAGRERDTLPAARKREGMDKVAGAVEYVADLMESQVDKVVVFAHHHEVLDAISGRLARFGVVAADGRVADAERTRRVAKFQTSADVRVIVAGTQACGTGITLHAADRVVFVEFDWTPGVMLQAEQRVHRIGQGRTVQCDWLVCPGTLDDRLFKVMVRKLEQIDAMTCPRVSVEEIVAGPA